MKANYFTVDTVQTLVRSVLKVGGGYLVARGWADESSVEVLTAGAITLAAIVWGIWHRAPSGSSKARVINQVPLLFVVVLALAGGCATENVRAFRAEKLATDAAYAGLLAWKDYYRAAVTNAPSDEALALQKCNEQVYAASRAFAATVKVADGIRETCATNAAASNMTALRLTLTAAEAHSSNLVWLVRTYMVGAK